MTYLYQLIVLLAKSYIWYSLLILILSISAYYLSKQIFSFVIISSIMIILGYISNVYPFWFVVLLIIAIFAFVIIDGKSFMGLRI